MEYLETPLLHRDSYRLFDGVGGWEGVGCDSLFVECGWVKNPCVELHLIRRAPKYCEELQIAKLLL